MEKTSFQHETHQHSHLDQPKSDIKIFSTKELNTYIDISPGTYLVGKNTDNYAEDAFLPKKQWKVLEKNNECLLKTNTDIGKLPYSWIVEIHRVSENFKKKYEHIGFNKYSDKKKLRELEKHSDYNNFLYDLLCEYQDKIGTKEGLRIGTIGANNPGLESVTINYNLSPPTFLGLHLDSFDKSSVKDAHLARNRICINLGLEPRYFLCVPKTLFGMVSEMGYPKDVFEKKIQQNGTGLCKEYMMKFPNTPVIRIKLDPWDYYITPTENMIHDGSSLGQTQKDVLLTMWGYFSSFFYK